MGQLISILVLAIDPVVFAHEGYKRHMNISLFISLSCQWIQSTQESSSRDGRLISSAEC